MIKPDDLKKMICYWIEVTHIDNAIGTLIEETDEIGEIYETSRYWRNNREDISIMDVHESLEVTGTQCSRLWSQIDSTIPKILMLCKESMPEIFGLYADVITEQDMPRVIEALYEGYDNIYTYNQEEQFNNFCNELLSACKYAVDKRNQPDTFKISDEEDDTDLPFN